ncbi:hypothetical protein [Tahibacter amnicola]|uniref:Uncharacterized protein n=1 Tax=Tahibacter amnicola TaxID=2976241 RepID=A0ABY6BE74_9GAMM|nr:hypothetical protein [Tahibacter amnicola]UXI66207.1 hypothetical protein N4264_15780 [Tahibacter amnicola]
MKFVLSCHRVLPRVFCALAALLGASAMASAEPTQIEVRVLARGAKFIGGYSASALVTLTDADTGEVLARGMTQGTTGDTDRIMKSPPKDGGRKATDDSAVFKASLDLTGARRVTATVTGPVSQPQAATTVTSTQWVLPGRHITAGEGWLLELPGLIVDLVEPAAYQWVDKQSTVPLQASVTMMCGCALSVDGHWRAGDTEVEVSVSINGKPQPAQRMTFDAAAGRFGTELKTQEPGIYEVEVRAWVAATNNAGVGRTTFFVR